MKRFFSKIITFSAVILLFGAFFAFSNNVKAEELSEAVMAVSPMMQTISLNPGETYTGSVTVVNLEKASEDLAYKVSVGSYNLKKSDEGKDDYSGVDVEERNQFNAMMDWITIDDEGATLAPGEKNVVNFTIKVPKNAPAGAQYASLLFMGAHEEDDDSNANVSIKSRTQLVSAIVANVAGKNIEKGSIIDNFMPSFLLDNKLEAASRVRNEGNVWTNAEYILQVWPLFSDEEICTNEEKPDTNLVLPETERYHVQTCDLPVAGVFKAKQIVKIFDEESVYEKIIVICPLWLMLVVVLAIVALIVWIVIRIRTHKKSAANE